MAFRFEHLTIWKEAITYASDIYVLTKAFPKDELFALTNQLRRAASSISTNIAEGAGANSKKDFAHFLDIAIKSAYETVSLLYFAQEQGYVTEVVRLSLYEDADRIVRKIKAFRLQLLNDKP